MRLLGFSVENYNTQELIQKVTSVVKFITQLIDLSDKGEDQDR